MSMLVHGVFPTKAFKECAAVVAPAYFLPKLEISAFSEHGAVNWLRAIKAASVSVAMSTIASTC